MTERITENIVRDFFRDNGYFDEDNDIRIEEQKSEIERVKKHLKTASKKGSGKSGFPEFIVTSLKDTNFVLVVECKADVKLHESKDRDDPVKYAVDGVLHYGLKLAKDYNVVAIAVSGTTKGATKVSNFVIPSGTTTIKELVNETGHIVDSLLPYPRHFVIPYSSISHHLSILLLLNFPIEFYYQLYHLSL